MVDLGDLLPWQAKGPTPGNTEDIALFGDLPEDKRRKFILVEDPQKNARVRVKVTLDQIEMSEIPDSYRKQNLCLPKSVLSCADARRRGELERKVDLLKKERRSILVHRLVGRMSVPVHLGGSDMEVDVPQISRSKRDREQKINELGYRMAWGQGRVFSGRPIFLSRACELSL